MELSLENKKQCMRPGSIWQRKQNGKWQRVYLESLYSRLLRDGAGYVDIQTEFGLESVRVFKFLSDYEFLGWARIKLKDLTKDKNLIPLMEDPTK